MLVFSSEDILGALWMGDESLSFNEFVERFKQVVSQGDEEGSELLFAMDSLMWLMRLVIEHGCCNVSQPVPDEAWSIVSIDDMVVDRYHFAPPQIDGTKPYFHLQEVMRKVLLRLPDQEQACIQAA